MKNTLKRSLALLLVLLFAIPTFAFAEDLGVEAVSVEDIALVEDVATDDVVVEQAEEPVEDDNLLAEANEVVLGEEEEIAEENEAEEIAETNGTISFDLGMPSAELGAPVAWNGGSATNSAMTGTDESIAYDYDGDGTYDAGDGDKYYAEGISTTDAGMLNEPKAPTRVGYAFAGWKIKGTNNMVTFASGVSTAAVPDGATLQAQWTAEPVSVTYHWKNAEDAVAGTAYSSSETVETATFDALLPNKDSLPYVPTGYKKGDWYLENTTTTRWYLSGDTLLDGDTESQYYTKAIPDAKRTRETLSANSHRWLVDLYAGYKKTYTVKFFDNGNKDAELPSQAVAAGDKIDSPHPDHTADNLTFAAWKIGSATGTALATDATAADSQNKVYYDAAKKKLVFLADFVATDLSLYATYTTGYHTITYHDVTTQNFDKFDATGVKPGGDASWTAITAQVQNGAVTKEPTYTAKGSKYVKGWKESGSSTYFTFGTTIDKDYDLYPDLQEGYTVNFYTLKNNNTSTYDASWATTSGNWELYPYCTTVTVAKNEKVSKPDVNPTYANADKTYAFKRWAVGSSSGTPYDFTKAVESNLNLYADYTETTDMVPVYVRYRDKDGAYPAETTYNNAGWATMTQYVVKGNKATAPTLPTPAGFTFTGWKEVVNNGAFSFNDTINGAMYVEAQYSATTWTVTIDPMDGAFADPSKATLSVNSTAPYLYTTLNYAGTHGSATDGTLFGTAPVMGVGGNILFAGLYLDSNLTQPFHCINEPLAGAVGQFYTTNNATKITGNTTLYAKYVGKDCTVKFRVPKANGQFASNVTGFTSVTVNTTDDTWEKVITIPYNNLITQGKTSADLVPGVVAKDGQTFGGWKTSTADWDISKDKVTDDTTILTAKFTANTWTVTFEPNNGAAAFEQNIVNDQKVNVTNTFVGAAKRPTKKGYRLVGWYADKDFTEGPYFDSWNGKDLAGTALSTTALAGPAITKNTTFYARWEEAEWTVRYMLAASGYNGSLDVKYTKVVDGNAVEKPVPDPTGPSGHTTDAFYGWYSDSGLLVPYDFSKPITAADVDTAGELKLYAKFDASYTVTFKTLETANNTTYTPTTKYVQKTGTATVSMTGKDTAYGKFIEWVDKDPMIYTDYKAVDLATKKITENTTFWARYTKATMRHVTFTATEAATFKPAEVYVKDGESVSAPEATLAGKEIAGWTDTSNGNDVTFPVTVSGGDKTFKASFKAKKYTVTFESNGGSTVNPLSTLEFDDTIAVSSNNTPSKTGSTFAGWYQNASLTVPFWRTGTEWDGTTHTATQVQDNITVYAKWTPKKQYVKLVLGSASEPSTVDGTTKKAVYDSHYIKGIAVASAGIADTDWYLEVNYDDTLPSLKAPVSTDNKQSFAGWYTDNQLTKPFAAGTKITSNITLYAKYMNAIGVNVTATSWIYDGKSHVGDYIVATAAAANAGDTAPTVTLQYKAKGAADTTYTATAPTGAGNWVVKASVPATATTAAAEATAEYTIFQKEVTLTWGTTTQFTYNGAEQAPTCTVSGTVNGETVTPTITGKGKMPGSYTASAALPETGNYKLAAGQTTTKAFTIVASTAEPKATAKVNEDGTVTITVTAADGTVVSTSTVKIGEAGSTDDFDITTKDNGDGTVTVTMTPKATSGFQLSAPITVTGKVEALPTPVAISKLKAGKGKFTVKWKGTTGIDGYMVQYGKGKKKAKKATPKTVAAGKTSLTVKKLKNKKNYYVRICTYRVVNGNTLQSKWSAWMKVKTK